MLMDLLQNQLYIPYTLLSQLYKFHKDWTSSFGVLTV